MRRPGSSRLHDGRQSRVSETLRVLIDRAIAGPARVRGPRVGSPTLAAWNGVRVGQWLFATGRVGQVTEVEETGAIGLAACLFEDGASVVRKRNTREFMIITDSVRLRYTAPPIRVGTVAHEREGVASIEHDELGAAQELERRLRRRWGRADGELTSETAYHGTSHCNNAPSDHDTIPRSFDLLGYGAHYLSKMSPTTHALVHGKLFDNP